MSDRLAVSAAFSVLMMAAFVLFGAESSQVEFGPASLRATSGATAPATFAAPGSVLASS